MTPLKIDCLGQILEVKLQNGGFSIFLDEHLVVEKTLDLAHENEKIEQCQFTIYQNKGTHVKDVVLNKLDSKPGKIAVEARLEMRFNRQTACMSYQLWLDNQPYVKGETPCAVLFHEIAPYAARSQQTVSWVGLISLVIKLFTTAKVIKLILAGASLAAYSWFFSFQFALSLIVCLVFHEYGHIRAMQYFGMKTKGIYLIPFLGGLAVTEDRMSSRWQEVVISIMGPTFGLVLSFVFAIAYWVTGTIFFAGLASYNALLNLFNLLPILPLDGGHVMKSIGFSMNHIAGLFIYILGAALGVYLSYTLGLALLGFFLLIGCFEFVFEWRNRHLSPLIPLKKYGQFFSAAWYVLTVCGFVGIVWYFAGLNEITALPLQILRS